MVKLLCGPDSYRRREYLKELRAEFLKKGVKVDDFDLESEIEVGMAIQSLRHVSLFSEESVVILNNLVEAQKKRGELKGIVKDAIKFSGRDLVIVEDKKPTKEWAYLLKSPVEVEEFELLKGVVWVSFVKKEIEKRKLKFSAPGLKILAELFEGDSWRLGTLLDKLSFYKPGEALGPEVIVEEGNVPSINLWALLNDLRHPLFGKRLAVLEKVFLAGEPAAKVFHLAAFRSKKELPLLARYDVAVKSGKIDYEEALLDLATR